MGLQAVRAVYKSGTLIFINPACTPKEGTEVMVTYLEEERTEGVSRQDPLLALRGRGKGGRLVERLLQARQEDTQRDEANPR